MKYSDLLQYAAERVIGLVFGATRLEDVSQRTQHRTIQGHQLALGYDAFIYNGLAELLKEVKGVSLAQKCYLWQSAFERLKVMDDFALRIQVCSVPPPPFFALGL